MEIEKLRRHTELVDEKASDLERNYRTASAELDAGVPPCALHPTLRPDTCIATPCTILHPNAIHLHLPPCRPWTLMNPPIIGGFVGSLLQLRDVSRTSKTARQVA